MSTTTNIADPTESKKANRRAELHVMHATALRRAKAYLGNDWPPVGDPMLHYDRDSAAYHAALVKIALAVKERACADFILATKLHDVVCQLADSNAAATLLRMIGDEP